VSPRRRLAWLPLLAVLAAGCALGARGASRALEPADPRWTTSHRGLAQINIRPAWALVPDASGAIVAVVDSGIAPAHPDLRSVVGGTTQCPRGGTDDEDGHGTKVAGIIGGRLDGTHAIGVAPSAQLRPYRFLCPSGFDDARAAAALADALAPARRPDVVNASWAAFPIDSAVAARIDGLVVANPGVLFVFAAPQASPPYPKGANPYAAAFTTRDNVLVVTAADATDRLLRTAGRDPSTVHLAAPGVAIATADIPAGGTTTFQGASAAAAFVSGCAALVKLAAPDPAAMTGARIRSVLLDTAERKTELRTGVIQGRRLDCGAAVSSVRR
jgi:subtilisin family serine protease